MAEPPPRPFPALAEFAPFVEIHAEFLEALVAHQEALVRGDLRGGLDAIEGLRRALGEHIARENTVILPVLEARGGWGRAGDPRFYREEHDRILALLDRAAAETAALATAGTRVHREIALLIGREQGLRTLLEHHDDRERRCLYPDLVAVTTPAERLALIG